ncbi:MAG TPA: glycosyltransferase family 39 protein, partial [Anaerolineales bacterium]|nr:glycosyltransferase family 39 protein [Anaerolineales bacterium]
MLKSLRDFLLGQRSGNIAFFFSLVAFVFSLLFLLYLGPVKAGDTPSYMSITNHILAGQFYTDLNDIFRPPGYPLFLALLLRVSGGQLAVVAIGQVFFFAATAGLTYLAARQVFGEKVARLSGWLVALNPALAYFAVVIEAEALLVFLTTCTLYLVISGVVRQQQRYFLFAGLASAIGLSIKPVGLPLGLLIVGAILFVPKLEKRLQKSIILLLPIMGVYFGWSAHNYIKFGALEYNPIYGLNLLERTAYLDDSQVSSKILKDARAIYQDRKERQVLGPQTDDMYYWWAVIETSRQYSATLNLTQKNSEFFNLAVELIKNNPTAYLRNT